MAEKEAIVFTKEQKKLFSDVERLMVGAIRARCAGCSNAKLAPEKAAGSVARGRLSEAGAAAIATRHFLCPGKFGEVIGTTPETTDEETGAIIPAEEIIVEMCHLPPGAPNGPAQTMH